MTSKNHNSKILQVVTGVLRVEDEFLGVIRSPELKVFPGYFAFPGGKVDEVDRLNEEALPTCVEQKISKHLFHTLARELEEELKIVLAKEYECGNLQSVLYRGYSITPDFHVQRFHNHYLEINLKKWPEMFGDEGEIDSIKIGRANDFLLEFERGEILTVPPTRQLLELYEKDSSGYFNYQFDYQFNQEIPWFEVLGGITLYMPKTNTFPPANRTNSFLLGDQDSLRLLVDPATRDEAEFERFYALLKKEKIGAIFLTHHHPDHHERVPEMARKLKLPLYLSGDTQSRLEAKFGVSYFNDIELHPIAEGDVLTRYQGESVRVYHVPGHDEGQMALAPDSMKWFLASDLIQTVGTVVIGGDEGDMSKYFDSLERVIKLNPKVVFPSHGIAMGGTSQIRKTLRHRKEREEQVRKLYQDNRSLEEMYAAIYPGLDAGLKRYAMATIEAHLKKLRADNEKIG